ncbi:MAG: phosphotransferase family protein [Acidimicrobiales bacterium]
MLTPPPDLAEDALVACLAEHWRLETTALAYQPLGFGAHHWTATDRDGTERFLTVHDLLAKRRADDDAPDDVFRRLTASFSAAKALEVAGLGFVLAPTTTAAGAVVARVDDRFSLAVHPFLAGHPAGPEGELTSAADRLVVLELVVEVHRASDAARPHADVDDLEVRHREEVPAALDAIGTSWDAGPYGERARQLLELTAAGLQQLVSAYGELRAQVEPLLERAVLTHGEPHASNVLVVDGRFLLIDWDTALLAPAERDLWVLEPGDGSILGAYERATGLEPSRPALDLYRLWYDLAEIGQYLGELRREHGSTDDMAESWRNLQHFLRPAERWPELVG